MAAATMAMSPAAGPETPSRDPLENPTMIPPITPAMIPEKMFGMPSISTDVDANPTPRHKGSATKKTTKLAGRSERQLENIDFIKMFCLFVWSG
jgi:hypothetical protein